MHKVPLLRAEVAVCEPSCSKRVEHVARIVRDVGPRLRRLPHIDVRGLQRDEVVELVAVNQIHPGQHTDGPIHRSVAVVPESPKSVVVHVQGDFDTVRVGVFPDQRPLHAVHAVHAAVLVLHGAGESVGPSTLGHVKEDVFLYEFLAPQVRRLRGKFPLVSVQNHGGEHAIAVHGEHPRESIS